MTQLTERELHATDNAQLWAEAFLATVVENGITIDEDMDTGFLIGWFANAIAAGDAHCYHNKMGGEWIRMFGDVGQELDRLRTMIGYGSKDEQRRIVAWLADEFGPEDSGSLETHP